jgi:glycosyltransferase involved in cell wall biosynthesis
MKFSIVITTYNRLSLLKRAIDSALAQTELCEVIVVDDGSSDGTDAYLQDLKGKVAFWRNSKNLGHSAAMNIGVKLAQGDWIKPLDDDDYLAPKCVETMMEAIQWHPQAVICSCQAVQVNIEGWEIYRTSQVGAGELFYISQADIHYGMLLEKVPFGTTSQVAFQKNAFLKSGGWDSSLDICDEIDSWIRIAQFGDAIFINSCLAYRTVWAGGDNQKSSLQKRLAINILMKEKIYALVDERHRAAIPSLEEIRNYLKLHWLLVALKQKQVSLAFSLAFPGILSPLAWKFLANAILFRTQGKFKKSQVRQSPQDLHNDNTRRDTRQLSARPEINLWTNS